MSDVGGLNPPVRPTAPVAATPAIGAEARGAGQSAADARPPPKGAQPPAAAEAAAPAAQARTADSVSLSPSLAGLAPGVKIEAVVAGRDVVGRTILKAEGATYVLAPPLPRSALPTGTAVLLEVRSVGSATAQVVPLQIGGRPAVSLPPLEVSLVALPARAPPRVTDPAADAAGGEDAAPVEDGASPRPAGTAAGTPAPPPRPAPTTRSAPGPAASTGPQAGAPQVDAVAGGSVGRGDATAADAVEAAPSGRPPSAEQGPGQTPRATPFPGEPRAPESGPAPGPAAPGARPPPPALPVSGPTTFGGATAQPLTAGKAELILTGDAPAPPRAAPVPVGGSEGRILTPLQFAPPFQDVAAQRVTSLYRTVATPIVPGGVQPSAPPPQGGQAPAQPMPAQPMPVWPQGFTPARVLPIGAAALAGPIPAPAAAGPEPATPKPAISTPAAPTPATPSPPIPGQAAGPMPSGPVQSGPPALMSEAAPPPAPLAEGSGQPVGTAAQRRPVPQPQLAGPAQIQAQPQPPQSAAPPAVSAGGIPAPTPAPTPTLAPTLAPGAPVAVRVVGPAEPVPAPASQAPAQAAASGPPTPDAAGDTFVPGPLTTPPASPTRFALPSFIRPEGVHQAAIPAPGQTPATAHAADPAQQAAPPAPEPMSAAAAEGPQRPPAPPFQAFPPSPGGGGPGTTPLPSASAPPLPGTPVQGGPLQPRTPEAAPAANQSSGTNQSVRPAVPEVPSQVSPQAPAAPGSGSAAPAMPPAAPPSASAPSPPAGPAQAQGGASVARVTGQVVAVTPPPAGSDAPPQVTFQTPRGTLSVAMERPPPLGAAMLLDLAELPPAPPSPLPPPALRPAAMATPPSPATIDAAAGWPSLGDLAHALEAVEPALAQRLAEGVAPGLSRSPAGIAALLVAMSRQAPEALVGRDVVEALKNAGRGGLVRRMGDELARAARAGAEGATAAEWRPMVMPFLHNGLIEPVSLFIRRQPPDGEGEGARREGGTRFLVNLSLSRLGQIQLDGMVRPRVLELVVRSPAALSPGLQSGLTARFGEILGAVGFSGVLGFQTGSRITLDARTLAASHNDLRI